MHFFFTHPILHATWGLGQSSTVGRYQNSWAKTGTRDIKFWAKWDSPSLSFLSSAVPCWCSDCLKPRNTYTRGHAQMTSAERGREGGTQILTVGGGGCVISIVTILTRGGGGQKSQKFSWRHLWMAPKWWRQGQVEVVVSKSRNKIHQTWGLPKVYLIVDLWVDLYIWANRHR